MRRIPVALALLLFATPTTCPAAGAAAPADRVELPMDRTAYVVGEKVPLGVRGAGGPVTLSAVGPRDERISLHEGEPAPLVWDTSRMAAGDYRLHVDGKDTGVVLTLVSPVRRSAGALTDEAVPSPLRLTREQRKDPAAVRQLTGEWRGQVRTTLDETGIDACFQMGADDMGRQPALDVLATGRTVLFANCDTRPMSFFPPRVWAPELAGYRQKLALAAQLNARYPNFAGFCFNWDPTGFFGRKGLMIYWTWGNQEPALRRYLERSDQAVRDEFRRRTGLEPVSEQEYVAYLLSIGRPEFAPAIDLPTSRWMNEIAAQIKPLPEAERVRLGKRIDAWSAFLMGLYEETFRGHLDELRPIAPSMRHTTTVQIDHCSTREGQYHPSAYRPLDLRYMSMWNDQVGGPDFAYQWVFSAAMLDTLNDGARPIWGGHALGMVHGRSPYPGKFVRAIAHNLAYHGSGAGFALEAFSNVLGGMNRQTHWENLRTTPAAEGLRAGREFLDRFSFLATRCGGAHGVGILYSKSQRAREHGAQGFGTTAYKAFVTLLRLGYTPRFVTEEEIVEQGTVRGVKVLVAFFQTVPLPWKVQAGIDRFARDGGKVLADAETLVELPGMERLPFGVRYYVGGKPHNLGAPNLPRGKDHSELAEEWFARLGPPMRKALGQTGLCALAPQTGAETRATCLQIDGGPDATYVVAVNDSHVHTHADWHQVRERLVPGASLAKDAVLCDLNEERLLGPAGPVECDLSATTARVFALLRRGIAKIDLRARQSARAGEKLALAVSFPDERGQRIEAVLPFHLSIARPDGSTAHALYRATDRQGSFALSLDLPTNAPAGRWTVTVRSQCTGQTAAVPVDVAPAPIQPGATALARTIVVRDRAGIERILGQKARPLVVPIFDTPRAAAMQRLAERVRDVLRPRGVDVQVLSKPQWTTCWLAYDPNAAQLAENARAEKGEAFGRIKRTTINRNDYYSARGGFAFGRNVLLLDLAGEADNEPAEHLDAEGALWPAASLDWPGRNGAVVQTVHRAFSPRASAIVVQAADANGLAAGIDALADLPADWITPSVESARARLLGGLNIAPAAGDTGAAKGLSAEGLTARDAPQPFRIHFRGATPPPADRLPPRPPADYPRLAVPTAFQPRHFIPQMLSGGECVEAMNPGGGYLTDARFYDAVELRVDVEKPGEVEVVAEGLFRYSDRRPRSQASWEDLLALRDRYVRPERRPLFFEVRLDGKPAGRLDRLTTARQLVPVETLPFYVKTPPRSVHEEVVAAAAGRVHLPAGAHKLLLVLRNIVDARLDRIRIGVNAEQADVIGKQRAEEDARRKAARQRAKGQ